MHFSTLVLFSLASRVLADTQTITNALSQVQSGTMALDNAVQLVNSPNLNQIAMVAQQSSTLGQTIMAAQTMIQNTRPIDLLGAIAVANAGCMLSDTLKKLTTDLILRKPIVDQAGAGLTAIVVQQLQMQQKASNSLIQTISTKVPVIAQPIAAMQGQTVNNILQTAILVFMLPPINGTSASSAASTGANPAGM